MECEVSFSNPFKSKMEIAVIKNGKAYMVKSVVYCDIWQS